MRKLSDKNKIIALAHSLAVNKIDICRFARFNGLEIAKDILQTLNEGGYDIVLKNQRPICPSCKLEMDQDKAGKAFCPEC